MRLKPWEISLKILGKIQEKQDDHLDCFGFGSGNKARKQIRDILTSLTVRERKKPKKNYLQVYVLEDALCCVVMFLC